MQHFVHHYQIITVSVYCMCHYHTCTTSLLVRSQMDTNLFFIIMQYLYDSSLQREKIGLYLYILLIFFFSVMFLGIFWLFRIILRPHHKVCCVLDIKQWQIYLYIMTVPFLQDIEEPGEDSTRFDCLMPTVVKPKAPSSRATYRGYPSYDSNQQVKVSPSLCQHESLPCPTLPSKPAAP